ncbi:MAG: TolB family protein [Acidimicrobiia bacterium]
MRPTVVSVVLSGLLLAGCDGGVADPAQMRLLVLGEDGNIATVLPDGSERRLLTEDAGRQHRYFQPTWSPAGDRVAFSELAVRDGTQASALVVADAEGDRQAAFETTSPAFYLSWSPDGEHLGYLGNAPGGIELGMVQTDGAAGQPEILTQGQPLYFSWAPDGQRLLAHIDGARMVTISLEGEASELDVSPAAFQAPQWSHDRRAFAVAADSGQQLVIAAPDDTRRQVVAFEGFISFLLSPDGDRIAYRALSATSPGELVVQSADGDRRSAARNPVVAFFWSPDGRKLLYLVPEPEEEAPWFRWYVWDGEESQPLGRFVPSPILARDYLPFFDQFAQSLSFWSPGSDAFVYAGRGEDGGEGIWIQRLGGDREPEPVTKGLFASWPPAGP